MRAAALFLVCSVALAQAPEYAALSLAYEELRAQRYEAAITSFLAAAEAAPERASIRKDLAYAYLKIGENIPAREQFHHAMELDPADAQVAMEYAFLCYETKERREARRIFDRIRKSADPVHAPAAEQAFQNVDAPLAAGIERWTKAIEAGADNFSAHFELATLAEERDELDLAAVHYERAWRLLPARRSVLLSLGRVWRDLNRAEDADTALLAASRGGEPRAAESARELLPDRYPFVAEFRRALEVDPGNAELRRDLGFLLLKLDEPSEGEREFQILVEMAPDDLLAATQLGFLLYARGDAEAAKPLFDRVLAGRDEELANRVRAVLRLPQAAAGQEAAAVAAKEMAERSIKAGYMKDAVRYLQAAHQSNPFDYDVMLRLGWAYNILRQDAEAIVWFDQARKSPDPQLAGEAWRAFRNLRDSNRSYHVSGWFYPLYSSRWSDLFGYGQLKVELKTGIPLVPYAGVRFIGDTRRTTGALTPLYLSESAFVPALGVRTPYWKGLMAWAEAGVSLGYLSRNAIADYRAGISFARAIGSFNAAEGAGWFAEGTTDAVAATRFGNDLIVYQQVRAGYAAGSSRMQAQFYWNGNVTFDARAQEWANFWETGPGVRILGPAVPGAGYITLDLLRGSYLKGGRQPYNDLRAGVWYAFRH